MEGEHSVKITAFLTEANDFVAKNVRNSVQYPFLYP